MNQINVFWRDFCLQFWHVHANHPSKYYIMSCTVYEIHMNLYSQNLYCDKHCIICVATISLKMPTFQQALNYMTSWFDATLTHSCNTTSYTISITYHIKSRWKYSPIYDYNIITISCWLTFFLSTQIIILKWYWGIAV